MIGVAEIRNITKTHKAILQTILYFDIFKYPLTVEELLENSSVHVNLISIRSLVNELVSLGCLKREKEFVMPYWADVSNVQRRIIGNKRAKEAMVLAENYSKKASRLPFVRGLCISGSLSKNYFDDQSDIDFFVITKANRVWLCRSIFLIFYKLLPKSKKKYYCLNYFISEEEMGIDDKNIFVATEIASLIPTYGYDKYKGFLKSNSWYKEWLINKIENDGRDCVESSKGALAIFIETFFGGAFGNWCDEFLRRRTKKGWIRRFKGGLSEREFEVMYRSDKHAAKRHEKGYQDKVLNALNEKMSVMENKFHQKLT